MTLKTSNIADDGEKFVASLDIGTTTLRCHVYDRQANIIGSGQSQIELIYSKPGYVEIDPEKLWADVVIVIKDAITAANLSAEQITCLGLSTQRSSFVTWQKSTGKVFHNVITWQDLRANDLVDSLNNSLWLKGFRFSSSLLHFVSRNERFLAGSVLKIMNTQVSPRLQWVLKNNSNVKEALARGDVAFGTLDSWILWKLSGDREHVTDASNAACTGFFDPFVMDWAAWALYMFEIPREILPKICDTSGFFFNTDSSIFGIPIPVTSSVADQSASLFGSCLFHKGSVKFTFGTGTFVDVNTGDRPHASTAGLYPIVAWRIKGKTTYMAEGASNDTGTIVNWAQKIGLLTDVSESSAIAKSVENTDGVCFLPFFSGAQAPINDGNACAGFLGLKPTTTAPHLIRAILESVVYRAGQLFNIVKKEMNANLTTISVDGGVAKNDFVLQFLADLTNSSVERPTSTEMSSLGAAFLAGLAQNIWSSPEELKKFHKIEKRFEPRNKTMNQNRFKLWLKAVQRVLSWYPSLS